MFVNSCPDCVALFAEMRSAIIEAKAITENAKVVRRPGNRRSPHVLKWWEITESWESARRRWREASTELKNHVATAPQHAHPAKRVAKV